jgi:DNA-binding response OmpR family regulator
VPLIAVVNDDTAFLQLMEDALTDEGYRVRLSMSTDGVADAIAREHPNLLILDIVVELRDAGLRLLRAIRGEPGLATLPVIVCSADTTFLRERADELASLRCAVMEKPFNLEGLFVQIAAMLETVPDAQAG